MSQREGEGERLTEDELLLELARLYNHLPDDSRQFTRWQMTTAIAHGYRLAALSRAPLSGEAKGLVEIEAERAAVLSSVEFLRAKYGKARCDDQAVSCCVRCNTMYLVRKMDTLLAALAPKEANDGTS